MTRPEEGWDGYPVEWLHQRAEYDDSGGDGVRAFAGAASRRVRAIGVEQGSQKWTVPVDSPCGAFIVVLDSLDPARLCALDERREVLHGPEGKPECIDLEDLHDVMNEQWPGELGSVPDTE
jgi:hypothetical protein